MLYHYFLSYARLDLTLDSKRCIPRFVDELDNELKRKLSLKQKERAGFFDDEALEHGELWPQGLGAALQSCGVFVGLYSPAYFNSEYCGKEWSIFESRLSKAREPLILPVLFDPPEDLEPLPEGLGDIKYDHNDYPEVYRKEGLKYLMVRNSPDLEDTFHGFLEALVRRIINCLAEYQLAPLEELPDIKSVQSRFNPRRQVSAGKGSIKDSSALIRKGPQYADFVYVVARREEVRGIKHSVDGYGEKDELDWKPFWPLPKEAKLLARDVAALERFQCQELRLSDHLVEQVKEALGEERIVILIADAWTLCLKRYQDIVSHYDQIGLWNSAVTITWNVDDPDTKGKRSQLKKAIEKSFAYKSRRDTKFHFVYANNADELKKSLGALLQRLKAEIIETSKNLRTIPSEIRKPDILASPEGSTL